VSTDEELLESWLEDVLSVVRAASALDEELERLRLDV